MEYASGIQRALDTERELNLSHLRRSLADVREGLTRVRKELFDMSCDLQKRPETLLHAGVRLLSLAGEIRELETREATILQSIEKLETPGRNGNPVDEEKAKAI
jgi:hypothetical protein